MASRTFVEKIFDAECGSIVFKKPDIVLTHDNTASIKKTLKRWVAIKLPTPINC